MEWRRPMSTDIKYKFCWALFVTIFVSLKLFPQKGNNVILKGKAINFNNQVQIADFSELSNFSLPDLERTFVPDSLGMFFISFTIEKPNYFKVGRNVLYLSPGDSLDVTIDYEYGERAEFKGRGVEANTYLKNTPFPKAGSYLKAGAEIKNSFENTVENILRIAEQRKEELLSYKNISEKFRNLELARIRADIINSLFDLRYYYSDVLPKDSAGLFIEKYNRKGKSLITKYSADFYDTELLKLEVYRDILHIINNNSKSNFKKGKAKNKIESWIFANRVASKLKNFSNKDSIRNLRTSIDKIDPSYKNLLAIIYSKKLSYGNGDGAINFIAKNEKDERASLDNYRGRVIYLDIWATWCGPCLNEMPYFEKLKEKYKENKNIVFVSLSIDNDEDKWKKYLELKKAEGNSWIVDRLKLNDYSVTAVPRTIIIDRDFKIFDMYAPPPSSVKTEIIIKKLIGP